MTSIADDREWFIYVLKDPRTDEVRYVGWTRDIKKRLRDHIRHARHEKNHRAHWLRSLLALGLRPIIEVIDSGTREWQSVERHWILRYRMDGADLTNGTNGGEGTLGRRNSAEHIERLRQINLGKKQPPEVIEKRRQSLLGRKHTPETIEKMRSSGKKRQNNPGGSYETMEKMRIANSIGVICVETNMTYESGAAAARAVGKKPQSIAHAIKTNTRCAGYHWEYIDKP